MVTATPPPQRPNPTRVVHEPSPVKAPPDPATVWRVVKVTLGAVICAVLGFGAVAVVEVHDSNAKTHQICASVHQGFDAYTQALLAAAKLPPSDPKARAFEALVAARLEHCS